MIKTKDNLAPFLFHQGTNYRAYEYMGAHVCDGKVVFRVWAPNAIAVYVTGDFCNWGIGSRMERITEGGIWEAELEYAFFSNSPIYKYRILSQSGEKLKADPYGFAMEKPPGTASLVTKPSAYKWRDEGWLTHRRNTMSNDRFYAQPVNIYELHLGSWKRNEDDEYLTYAELAADLVNYVKQMGYTHIELMPIMEHPFDGSWGYQVCGYYAPTARYGTPDDFKAFVDTMHEAGIGVILDWVPAHFPKDAHGLYEFDGAPLYEYQGSDRMEHKNWGTRCFDVGREEIQSFLISNAVYWAEEFHADGLRVDAVASMLYLDYDREPGEWVPNAYGDNKNLEAIAFFKKLNSYMATEYPDVMVIAEESTAWGNLTGFENDGMGFSMKWNMGWMNDILSYVQLDPIYKKFHHEKTTFSLTYSFNERYALPISHDEVVHGKKSLLDRMPGEYEAKFANTRAFITYMMTHPGKKLMFMGGEIGQFREWDYEGQIEWFLLDYDMHARLQLFFADINHLYLSRPELYEIDGGWDGFKWINPDDKDRSILSYRRTDRKGNELITVVNFTPVGYNDYIIEVPHSGVYEELINSDAEKYGGTGVLNKGRLISVKNGDRNILSINVPPSGALILGLNLDKKLTE